MYPELPFSLPFGITIKTYGLCVMVGFLTATWFTMRRAQRVKCDPDLVLNLCFLALIFGMIGARVFFVIHYWESQFAHVPNRLLAIVDIREGGLEFLGAVLGGVPALLVYLRLKRASMRVYLDLFAPSLMWGLALGRIGCFFNGCCYGGPCVQTDASGASVPALPWAISFPYGSAAQLRHWEDRLVTIPAELLVTADGHSGASRSFPVPAEALSMSVERREGPLRAAAKAQEALQAAVAAGAPEEEVRKLQQEAEVAERQRDVHLRKHNLDLLALAQTYPSRANPERIISVSELEDLAAGCASLPVHPTQLYASVNAFLLCFLLTALFYVRKRHGVVFGAMLVLYPVARFILEIIRTDNPRDVLGLTVSQFICVLLFLIGVAYLVVLYRFLPQRSPYAVAYVPPEEPAPRR
ncbi:MAG TPA: prolipoprotein diacylglyceryl transferase [Phycisphaerae bacterium]|nr:prolipoprotein diacylglyceryl transferase [Phycisphaerae bacterium]HNU46120.1 prolipoprotein diacylglyceryl transferase [Phycisphaerae bacterium]